MLAAERHRGDVVGKGIGRVHGILLRREREQGVDHGRQVGADQFLSRAILGALSAHQ